VANGFTHDLPGRVFRGRAVFGESDPVPLLCILEGGRQEDGAHAGELGVVRDEPWPLLLQGWAEEDRANPADGLYQLKASVEQRLAEIVATTPRGLPANPDAYLLGRRVTGLQIGPGVVRPPDQVSARSYFFLPLVLRWVVDLRANFTMS
jgi:hypothetical protein